MRPAAERILEIIKILRREYPDSHTALKFRTPLQILVATVLSAQCTDKRVNAITPYIFNKYRTVYDFAKARQSALEQDIHSVGFYKNKARHIIALSKKIAADYKGKVPGTMTDLVSLPGVGRKTANIVISSAFKKAEGIAVDTHVRRLSKRLGLSAQDNPDKIEKDLIKIVPERDWICFNYLLVNHGRKICKAPKPLCPECVIKDLCPSAYRI